MSPMIERAQEKLDNIRNQLLELSERISDPDFSNEIGDAIIHLDEASDRLIEVEMEDLDNDVIDEEDE